MRKVLLVALACVYAPLASASNDFTSGPLFPKFVTSQSNGIATVAFAATGANGQSTRGGTVPGCATDSGSTSTYRFAFSITTDAGKGMLAVLLAAHAAGEGVWFNGTGDCGVLAGAESLLSVQTGN